MSQLALDFSRARNTDPATSHDAADRVPEFAHGHFRKILDALDDMGRAATYHEIAVFAGLEPHAAGKRMSELEAAGLIFRTDETHATPSGRQAHMWRLVG